MEIKNSIGNILSFNSNEKKTSEKGHAHQKINEKDTFLALTNSKMKMFSKF
jgi:hypothetical protein